MTVGAELDEVGCFKGGGGLKDAGRGDDANAVIVDAREALFVRR